MIASTTRVATTVPRRHLAQLCRHFADDHEVPVEQTDSHGRIEFPTSICMLDADLDALVLRVDAEDAETLTRTESLMARHIKRLGLAAPASLVWAPAAQ